MGQSLYVDMGASCISSMEGYVDSNSMRRSGVVISRWIIIW